MPDMTSLLSRPAAAVEPPKQLPPGDFIFQIYNLKKDRKSQAGNQMIDFSVNAVQPVDVPADQLEGINFPFDMTYTQTVTEKSLYRLVDFLNLTLKIDKETLSVEEMLDQSIGRSFRGSVTLQPSQKPGNNQLYSNITSVYPLD